MNCQKIFEPMFDYQNLIIQNKIHSAEELNKFFWNEVAYEWADLYKKDFPKHGEITLQNFYDFAFLIDHIWATQFEQDSELPETRVVGFFGISNTNINESNRKMMRKFWAKLQLLSNSLVIITTKVILWHMVLAVLL